MIDPAAYPGLRSAVEGRTLVVKLGGSVGQDDTLPDDASLLQTLGAHVVLVHGGGPAITGWLDRIGKETLFVHGLRFTDGETLQIVRMVLSGLVNGEIVARVGQAGARCVGLSGADDSLIVAKVLDAEVGLVGEVTSINPAPIRALLGLGYIVVVSPVAIDGNGGFLNVNADTAAAEISVALAGDRFVFLTDVDGIRAADGAVARHLTPAEAQNWIDDGTIHGGMIPKVDACVRALHGRSGAQIVDGRQPHVLLAALAQPEHVGTTLSANAPARR